MIKKNIFADVVDDNNLIYNINGNQLIIKGS